MFSGVEKGAMGANGLKSHGQISKKWYVLKYCLCDTVHHFLAL